MSQKTPLIVLVEPQMGENIGAAARGMLNFGLDRMRIVNPRDGWPNERAVAMAAGAAQVIDNATIHATTREAVADAQHIYATTARPRGMTKRVVTPRFAAQEMREKMAAGEEVAILFGRERSGLENDDIILSNTIITAPVNPGFASLNLAQCVLLIGYEWLQAADGTPPSAYNPGKSGLASHQSVDRVLDFMEAELREAGFFWPDEKAASMVEALRNLYHRAPLTEADTRILWGATRALAGKRNQGGNSDAS